MLFAQQQRINNINRIKLGFVKAAQKGGGLYKNKLVAQLGQELGCTDRKAREYIDELINCDFIEEVLMSGGLLILKEQEKIDLPIDKEAQDVLSNAQMAPNASNEVLKPTPELLFSQV